MLELIVFAPLAGGVLAYVLSTYFRVRAAPLVAVLGAFLCFAFAAIPIMDLVRNGGSVSSLDGLLYMDSLSAFFTGITALVSFIVFVYAVGYMKTEVEHGEVPENRIGLFYALLSIFLAAMLTATLASNLIVMWAAIEFTTLAATFLISFYNKHESIEAAWKFFLINSVGMTVALVGILSLALVMSNSGSAVNLDIPSLLTLASKVDPTALKIIFAIVLVGFGTKVGFVPLHVWLPDAHGQAPTPVSSLLSGVLLNIAFYAILRIYYIASSMTDVASFASSLFIFFGIISLGLAAMRLLFQTNIKRMLAYSSVENMGIVAIAMGIGGPLGTFAAFFHIAAHSLVKPLAFMLNGVVGLAYNTKDMGKITGVSETMPVFGMLLVITMLGIVGSLPFGTFFSEIALIAAALSVKNLVVVALVILFVTIAFGTMLYRGSTMVYGKKPADLRHFNTDITMVFAIFLLITLSLYLTMLAPGPLMALIQSVVKMFVRGA